MQGDRSGDEGSGKWYGGFWSMVSFLQSCGVCLFIYLFVCLFVYLLVCCLIQLWDTASQERFGSMVSRVLGYR